MKKFMISLMLFLFGIYQVLLAGDLVREKREVDNFKKISLEGYGKVYLTQGDEVTLEVETNEDFLDNVHTWVSGKTLHLKTKSDWRWWKSFKKPTLYYYITVGDLDAISISGAGELECNRFVTDELEIAISGAGEATLEEFRGEDLEIDISGVGEFMVAGECQGLDLSISGAGEVDAGDLQTSDASVKISGSGDAVVWTEGSLDLSISGSGDVRYYGSPRVSSSVSGAGSMKNLGAK